MRSPCKSKMLVDDERTRVTRFEFQPDQETGWHEHEFGYVITAITSTGGMETYARNNTQDHILPKNWPCVK